MKTYHIAVDVQNLWYACRSVFGRDARVDFESLLDLITDTVVTGNDCVINATAYMVVSSNHDQTNFVNALKALNFNVKKRNIYFINRGRGRSPDVVNTNWDVGITADAFVNAMDYDTFVLVSGDGDFTYLVEPLVEMGKEVVVMSFEESLNKSLASAASRIVPLGKDQVYEPRRRFDESQREREE